MSTKTTRTFEDRLLGELQREIALRAEERPEPVIRRRITPRRAVVALAACVAAVGVVVALPSSTGGSQAYAVERNDDGSVTVSMKEIILSGDDKRELAERLRAEGIQVSIDRPRSGFVCAQPRGEMYSPRWSFEGSGDVMVERPYVLRPGDTLVFEDPEPVKGSVSPAGSMYAVKGKAEPCREVPWEGLRSFEESLD
ncbi:hypothetical protein [Streptomyces caniscabiei]|uniref:Uncharacterized protein n=1 Tax=Streptomyces caniscabiei TaxID=2746961 RepID=A0A927QNA0_9ACTN|nr:hypothetical protein [Streptomyces caniscabiei]MBD9702713.1 hypothetical protein [Streptomyces caniscabiei]MBD9727737.1 hypothetical protein [Streptomyces caniscabiei]MDX3512850.1 hypothetical protein [Streptomyces caniscabiei]MDX3721888.1 hypothetical protein [Streptomyces caniscabiei]MDX3728518.1 hypothetical protein [Streptomyces caniscabiei]